MNKEEYLRETGATKSERLWEDGFMSLDGEEIMTDDNHCFDCEQLLDECVCLSASELATTMLEWERKRLALNDLELVIEAAVLSLGKTQTVGSVRATYSAGKKKYQYEDAAYEQLGKEQNHIIEQHTTPKTDWRSVCKDAGIEAEFTQGEPYVSLKLLE